MGKKFKLIFYKLDMGYFLNLFMIIYKGYIKEIMMC